ncbi:MAG TPA: hypothetical protein P5121_33360 [Caldilineaceae bacterium]|nr:hypothetical protein [Caldilineaceae bacterium]
MVDLLPTLCDLSGLPIPVQAAGQSLVPLLQGDVGGRDAVFAEQYAPDNPLRWVAVRTQQYVYTHYPNTGDELLFDLQADSREEMNLLRRTSEPTASARAMADALRQQIQAWLHNEPNPK